MHKIKLPRKSKLCQEHQPFHHDPPGHTCGLPCCNTDLLIQVKVQPTHGCISIPRESEYSNFIFRRRQLLKGHPTFTNGFFTLQSRNANQKGIHFGSTRNLRETRTSTLPGENLQKKEYDYLKNRAVTLPNFGVTGRDISAKRDMQLEGFATGESNDLSSDSEEHYYIPFPDSEKMLPVIASDPRLPLNSASLKCGMRSNCETSTSGSNCYESITSSKSFFKVPDWKIAKWNREHMPDNQSSSSSSTSSSSPPNSVAFSQPIRVDNQYSSAREKRAQLRKGNTREIDTSPISMPLNPSSFVTNIYGKIPVDQIPRKIRSSIRPNSFYPDI